MPAWVVDLLNRLNSTFVVDGRWQWCVSGLGYTLLISLFSVLLGLVIGILMALMRLSKSKILRAVSGIYIDIIRGTPTTVQLLIIYIVIFVLLYLFKKRRTISWNYMFEGIFCIYCVTLLNLTGIFTLSYSLNGPFNYNLLPFIGSSIVPILLNFALFCPLGFLLPLVFRSCRGNWKRWRLLAV